MRRIICNILTALVILVALYFVAGELLFPRIDGGLERFVKATGPAVLREWARGEVEKYRQEIVERKDGEGVRWISVPPSFEQLSKFARASVAGAWVEVSDDGSNACVCVGLGSPIWESHVLYIGGEEAYTPVGTASISPRRKLADGIWYEYRGGK